MPKRFEAVCRCGAIAMGSGLTQFLKWVREHLKECGKSIRIKTLKD